MTAARVFKQLVQVTISLAAYTACPAFGGTILGLGATNGYVSALTVRGDTLDVGGRFTWAGPACGGSGGFATLALRTQSEKFSLVQGRRPRSKTAGAA